MCIEELISSSDQQVVIFLSTLLLLEYILATQQNVQTARVNDGLHSMSTGLISCIPKLLVTNIQTASYSFVYEKIYGSPNSDNFPSPFQWCLTFAAIDLGYYWFHRAAHEINIFWAAHQVHHSSEDYNMTTALRQSVVQQCLCWIFYIPLASIGIHPSSLKDLLWFSCLYQIWTHTEVVDSLGPLEYVFVTPSHHRVHHGRNPYCIDKNYGGILIIWDRIFGTFAEEKEEARPVYGLVVERVNNWNPIWTQLSHYCVLIEAVWNMPGISNKLSLLFKGPSWSPGKPRLGDGTYDAVQYPVVKYDRTLPLPLQIYITCHFLLVFLFYFKYLAISGSASLATTIGVVLYLLFTLTTFGALFDHKWYGPLMECARCIVFMTSGTINQEVPWTRDHAHSLVSSTVGFTRSIFVLSLTMWFLIETMGIAWTGSCRAMEVITTEYPQCPEKTHHSKDINHNFPEKIANDGIIFSRVNSA